MQGIDDNTAETNFYRFTGKKLPGMATSNGFNQTTPTLPKPPTKIYPKKLKPVIKADIPRYNEWLGSTAGNQLIQTLKDENDILKGEVESLRSYLKSSVVIYHQIELENKQINSLLTQKDSDIERILQSIVINDNEIELDYQHQIESYKQELELLMKHLQEKQESSQQQDVAHQELQSQLIRAKQFNDQIQNNLGGALQREMSLTDNTEITKLKNIELNRVNEELSLLVDPLQIEIKQIKTQLQQLISENEESKQSILKQQREEKIKIKYLTEQNEALNSNLLKIQASQATKETHINKFKDANTSLSHDQSKLEKIIESLNQDNKNLSEQIQLEQARRTESLKREQKVAIESKQVKEEQRILELKLQQVSKDIRDKEMSFDNEIISESSRHLKQIESMKQIYIKQLKEQGIQISDLESKLEELRKNNELLILKSEKLSKENMDFGIKLKDYQQSLRTVADQNIKILDLNKTILELNEQIQQIKAQQYQINFQNEQRIEQLSEEIKNLMYQNDNYFHQSEQNYHNQGRNINIINQKQNQEKIDDLERERDLLQLENNKIKKFDDKIKKNYEEAETTIGSLNNLNRKLGDQLKLDEHNKEKLLELTDENKILKSDNKLLREEMRAMEKLLNQTGRSPAIQSTRPSSAQPSNNKIQEPNNYYSPNNPYATNNPYASPPTNNNQSKPFFNPSKVENDSKDRQPIDRSPIDRQRNEKYLNITNERQKANKDQERLDKKNRESQNVNRNLNENNTFGRLKDVNNYQSQQQLPNRYRTDVMVIDYPVKGGNMKPVEVNYNFQYR